MQKNRGYFQIVSAGFLLAVCTEAIHALDRDHDWQTAVLARALIGVLFLVFFAWPQRASFVFFQSRLLLRSILVSIFMIGYVYAASVISPADVVTIMSSQPLWIAIVSILLFRTRYYSHLWVICILLLLGVWFVTSASEVDYMWIILMFLVLTMFMAMGTVMVRFVKDIPASIQTLHMTLVMSIIALVLFFGSSGHEHINTFFNPSGLSLLVIVGVTGSLYQFYSVKVVHAIGPVHAGIMPIVAVVFSYIMDIFLWNEAVLWTRFLGMFLVFASMTWLVVGKNLKDAKP